MIRALAVVLLAGSLLNATSLSDSASCAGPYQGYPGGSQMPCVPLDNKTSTDPGVLRESTFSFVRTVSGIPVGEVASAVFYGTDDRYHLYYQATVFPNAPEPIDYLEIASVFPADPRVYPVDVAIRTDMVASGFVPASSQPELVAFSAGFRSALNLEAEYVAPNGRCTGNSCPGIGSSLSPGDSSVTFELTSSFPFAGWSHYPYASMSGVYSPITGLNRYYADDILVLTPAPEPTSSALIALPVIVLLISHRRVGLSCRRKAPSSR